MGAWPDGFRTGLMQTSLENMPTNWADLGGPKMYTVSVYFSADPTDHKVPTNGLRFGLRDIYVA